MPRRSGTDVLFRNGRVRRFFLPGAFFFRMLFYPSRPVLRCHPRPASVAVLVCVVSPACVVSPLVSCLRLCPCRRSCLVPRRCSGLCCVVILGLHRLPSPFVPCRRSDLRRIVIRCLRRVAVPVCGWRPPPQNSADGLTGILPPAAGLLRPFPALRRFRSVARPLFVALNFQISFYFRTFARL